mmetsp:Transcript_8158/g.22138  ORF Transcript_8158/g.22138 Transcript_8158/m.22138 type:complete len:219 (-) Transcript_8158:243-899(-)
MLAHLLKADSLANGRVQHLQEPIAADERWPILRVGKCCLHVALELHQDAVRVGAKHQHLGRQSDFQRGPEIILDVYRLASGQLLVLLSVLEMLIPRRIRVDLLRHVELAAAAQRLGELDDFRGDVLGDGRLEQHVECHMRIIADVRGLFDVAQQPTRTVGANDRRRVGGEVQLDYVLVHGRDVASRRDGNEEAFGIQVPQILDGPVRELVVGPQQRAI